MLTDVKEVKPAKRIKGVVDTIFPYRRYGFIVADDGQEVFIRTRDIKNKKRSLRLGDEVEFEITHTKKGLRAKDIIILSPQLDTDSSTKPDDYISDKFYDEADPFYFKAINAKKYKDYEKARYFFKKAITLTDDPSIFLEYVAMEVKLKRLKEALHILKMAIEKIPSSGVLYEQYGIRLRQQKKLEEAVKVLKQGLQADPDFAKQLHYALALVLADFNDPNSLEEAIFHAEKAKQLGRPLDKGLRLKLYFSKEPILSNKARYFLESVGFDVLVNAYTKRLANLSVSTSEIEFTQSYNLTGDILTRCFFQNIQKKDINQLIKDLRDLPKTNSTFNFNTDIAFLVIDNAKPWKDFLYRIIEDNREIIIPLDSAIFAQAEAEGDTTNVFREVMDNWLSRRDLFHNRYPVSGRRFFGRENELHSLMRNIDDGQHIGIYGLRKVGKTSLLYQLKEKRPQDLVIYVDLQQMALSKDCAYLYWQIARKLQEALLEKQDLIPEANQTILTLGSVTDYTLLDNPTEKNALRFDADINRILNALANNALTQSSKIVLTIDELEWMLPVPGHSVGFKGYAEFFAYLRGIAQQTQGKVVTVITAANPTISEASTWDGRDNPVFQFYKDVFLPPLSQQECNEMIEKLGRGMAVSFDTDSLDYIYHQTGGHPYLTRQLCSHVVSQNPSRPLHINQQLVANNIKTFIRDKSAIFQEILDRLNYFPQEKALFFSIAEGLSAEDDLANLVDKPINIALRHLIGYQIVAYKNGHYHIKINLLLQWLQHIQRYNKE